MNFRGQYWFLSNFYPCLVLDYPSAEHLYQAYKSIDPHEREHIRTMESPARAKRWGAQIRTRNPKFFADPEFRLRLMYRVVRAKFFNNPDLASLLMDTGDMELVEENWWGDTYWGTCKGKGSNHLGKILMRVRAELRNQP